MKKSDMKIWMRMGDNDDYHDFSDPFEAGSELGNYLSETGTDKFKASDVRWQDLGLQIGGFTGYNYVSLFWGDNDAQDANKLTKADKAQFVAGIRDGGYFFQKPVRKFIKPKSKRKSKKSSSPSTSLRMMR